ncbi:MAG TPA: hypothetical protein P5514_09695 [Bacteroidales bacterium]|nr:hypothetical protein [Bacteroidales bacterium]HPE56661.1 hypothetical protein [Bacteroidales bacterium]HRX97204.1 hypothetical protein [Bacteroidales bacterium]
MYKFRNIISAVLLLSALVLILNNVFPHHHHEQQVCFVSEHCEDEDANGNIADPDHGLSHQHDNKGAEFCKIHGIYIITDSKNTNSKTHSQRLQKNHLYSAFLQGNESEQMVLSFHSIKPPDGVSKIYFVKSLTRALRAPPAC